MGINIEILSTLIIISISCSLLGVFLVLKEMSMMTNGITHIVLLGIVLGFLITNDLSSPFLIIGASLMGIITVYMVNLLSETKLMKEDAAIGVITSFFFSTAIILITRFADNTNLSIDSVLMGEIIFVPLNRMVLLGKSIPQNLFVSSVILLLNISVIFIFYKELKLSTFDKLLAIGFGFSPIILNYIFTTLVSITIVGSFECVGAILIISFMVGPAISAYLLFDRLDLMIVASILIGIISSILGFLISTYFDLSISGTIASTMGLIFLITLFFSPKKGILKNIIDKNNIKLTYLIILMLIYLYNKSKNQNNKNTNLEQLSDSLNWDMKILSKIIKITKDKEYIVINKEKIAITDNGIKYLKEYFS